MQLQFVGRVPLWNHPHFPERRLPAMNPETILAKSPKGLAEIETRANKLGARLRQVLIRVDGAKSADQLCAEAGDMGDTVWAQLEELLQGGYLADVTPVEAVPVAAPAPAPVKAAAPPPSPAPVQVAASTPSVALPQGGGKTAAPRPQPAMPAPAPAAVEFNSPVKFKLQDLLMEAVGVETGRLGLALQNCRNRDDLARWVDAVAAPIEAQSGKSKAKAFRKAAKTLVGG